MAVYRSWSEVTAETLRGVAEFLREWREARADAAQAQRARDRERVEAMRRARDRLGLAGELLLTLALLPFLLAFTVCRTIFGLVVAIPLILLLAFVWATVRWVVRAPPWS